VSGLIALYLLLNNEPSFLSSQPVPPLRVSTPLNVCLYNLTEKKSKNKIIKNNQKMPVFCENTLYFLNLKGKIPRFVRTAHQRAIQGSQCTPWKRSYWS
jgi:hypothetical protein